MTLRLRALTEEETRVIKKVSQSRTEEARLVERANIIRLANEGKTVSQIAAAVSIDEKTVRKWLKRFAEQGLVGLADAPRSGAPARYTPEVKAEIVATALRRPKELGQPFGSWTFERLATYLREERGVGMKKTRIFAILREEGLRWRHEETWFGERVDPDFAQKRGSSKRSTPPRPRRVW